ncbi:MAG: hypothetical protein R2724_18205 [Bryobacterales bacterium]
MCGANRLHESSRLPRRGRTAAFRAINPPKRIAAILTEYRPGSHADVTVGKYLEGWLQDGKSPGPRSKIVSMYTEQVPDNDMSRPMAAKYGIPLYRTIHEALTLGGDDLAVDGVLLIGEHGDYPMNDKDQKLYPRFKMFLEITDTYAALVTPHRSSAPLPLHQPRTSRFPWVSR